MEPSFISQIESSTEFSNIRYTFKQKTYSQSVYLKKVLISILVTMALGTSAIAYNPSSNYSCHTLRSSSQQYSINREAEDRSLAIIQAREAQKNLLPKCRG